MKPSIVLIAILLTGLCSCTTLSNRRDMYSPQPVMGPYTRMLKNGIPRQKTQIVTVTSSNDGAGKAYVPPR